MKLSGFVLALLAATTIPIGADERLAVEAPNVMLAPATWSWRR